MPDINEINSQTNSSVEAFGKLIFTPKEKFYPTLPDLNILVFKHPEDNGIYTFSAACIQLELDTCGDSIEEVKEELFQAIKLYFNAQARSCNSMEEFTQKIIDTIYSTSNQKTKLFDSYRNAKRDYLMRLAKKSSVQLPRIEPSNFTSFLFNNNIELSTVQTN